MKSIFKGKNIRKVYDFIPWNSRNDISIIEQILNHETILSTDLDTPPLQVRDQFYLTDKDKLVVIENAVRGTDNIMVYFTDYIINTEEELIKSLELAKDKQAEYLLEKESRNYKLSIEREKRDYRDKYEDAFFIKRWFMKKPE